MRLAPLLFTGLSESAQVCAPAAAVIINDTHGQTICTGPGKQSNSSDTAPRAPRDALGG